MRGIKARGNLVAIAGLPEPRWNLEAACPKCMRSAALVLYLAGGRMPADGAVRLEALCNDCGHVWELPQEGAAAARAAGPPGTRRSTKTK